LKCHFCGGQLVRTKVPYTVHRNGYHLVVDSVPGWLCKQCGETYFEEAAVNGIQKAVRTLEAKVPSIHVQRPERRASTNR